MCRRCVLDAIESRMKENFDVFDFVISDEDMATIASLDRGESLFFSHADPKIVEMMDSLVINRRGRE